MSGDKETRRLIQNIVAQVSRTNERIGSIHTLFERLDSELERPHIGADERVDEEDKLFRVWRRRLFLAVDLSSLSI